MFSCSACFRRALTTLLSGFPASPAAPAAATRTSTRFSTSASSSSTFQNSFHLPRKRSTHNHGAGASTTRTHAAATQKRQHSTAESLRKGHHRRVLREAVASKKPIPRSKRAIRKGPPPATVRDLKARERNRETLGFDTSLSSSLSPDGSVGQILRNGQTKDEYAAQFLTDPLKLANAVRTRLRMGDVQGSLDLVRASDREKVENVVSWNHVMDYQMSVQDVKGALRVYNEMKKRGHKPDAHTYTIMLRGFTANIQKPQAVQNALGVYNSMFAPNSTVTPNIIHTNAVIKVCARGNDMDALWSIAGRLPEKGPGAPDKWTFTTILNALASNAQTKASELQKGREPDEHDEQVQKTFDQAVEDGRKLWGDVVGRWRKGDLMVDQPLVCAMGRLLLLGSRRSGWEDVFRLVEQTMNIPRWTPAGGEEQKMLASPEAESGFEPVEVEASGGNGKTGPDKVGVSAYAQPSNNALSMLMQAAIVTKNVPAGRMYWDLLTDATGPYKLEPDTANLSSYLRLLRISRSSKVVVDLLRNELFTRNETLAKEFYKRGTFVIAMSTCVRDKNNPNVFEHANRVIDIMQERLPEEMDPKVMEMYVNLAVLTTPGVGGASPWREATMKREVATMNAVRALRRVGPWVVNVKEMMKRAVEEEDWVRGGRWSGIGKRGERRGKPGGVGVDDLAAFLRAMVGAYDRLLSKGAEAGVERVWLEEWLGQKRKLSAFVTKMVDGSRSSGRKTGAEDGEEVDEVEHEMKDKRWERNPVRPEVRKGPLTKAERRGERVKRDFPDPREVRRFKQRGMGELGDKMGMEHQKGADREGGVVFKSWGAAAFAEMEKGQGKGKGNVHGIAL